MKITKAIDNALNPFLVTINKIRQVRDSYPVWVWRVIPSAITTPLQELFDFAEAYDRAKALAEREASKS